LLKVDDPQAQHAVLELIMNAGMTVRETEQLTDVPHITPTSARTLLTQLRSSNQPAPTTPGTSTKGKSTSENDVTTIDDHSIARELEARLSTPVSIQRTPRDVRLTLVFHSAEKLQEFLDMFS
jgi:ParB family chromosome partitioning protein